MSSEREFYQLFIARVSVIPISQCKYNVKTVNQHQIRFEDLIYKKPVLAYCFAFFSYKFKDSKITALFFLRKKCNVSDPGWFWIL